MKRVLFILVIALSSLTIVAQDRGGLVIKGYRVLMDTTYDKPVEPRASAIISKYRPKMERAMMEVVGKSDVEMRSGKPESLLSNFAADAMLSYSSKFGGADFAITNFGGLRAAMPAGDVRRYDIFSIFPFENYLVIVEIPGHQVRELFGFFAKNGPQAISGNVKYAIKDRKLEGEPLINGKPISDERSYKVATLDFLLTGGDDLTMLKENLGVVTTGVLLRDIIFDRIENMMKRDGKIHSDLDGRVTLIK